MRRGRAIHARIDDIGAACADTGGNPSRVGGSSRQATSAVPNENSVPARVRRIIIGGGSRQAPPTFTSKITVPGVRAGSLNHHRLGFHARSNDINEITEQNHCPGRWRLGHGRRHGLGRAP
jgi:hypothetical protein